jgi:hypothetical protein
MVFQQPNPFAMSIYKNVAFGLRLNGYRGDLHERVEQALRAAALWDEVKDKLKASGLSLSGGQQQRLCIARAVATGRVEGWRAHGRVRWRIPGFRRGPQSGSPGHVSNPRHIGRVEGWRGAP